MQKNDNCAFDLLCKKFNPLLKKYSRLLLYDEAYEDLLYCFILCIYKIPINEESFINNNATILSYIKVTIKNQYIFLSKKHTKSMRYTCSYDSLLIEFSDNNDSHNQIQDKLYLFELKRYLNNNEINLVNLKFILQYSDSEIAEVYHISRQAVNKRLCKLKIKIKDLYLKGAM